jgi:hypothetical protein
MTWSRAGKEATALLDVPAADERRQRRRLSGGGGGCDGEETETRTSSAMDLSHSPRNSRNRERALREVRGALAPDSRGWWPILSHQSPPFSDYRTSSPTSMPAHSISRIPTIARSSHPRNGAAQRGRSHWEGPLRCGSPRLSLPASLRCANVMAAVVVLNYITKNGGQHQTGAECWAEGEVVMGE